MMIKKIETILAIILLFSISIYATASEVTLKNGDRVSGTIVDENEKSVVIETEYAGKVTIAKDFIAKLEKSKEAIIAKADVKPIADKSAAVKPTAATQSPKRKAGHIRDLASGWDGSANIGFSYTSGNSNNITMATGMRASKVSPKDGITIYVRSLWNSDHGTRNVVTTQNAFWGGLRYDRTIDKRVFGFVSYDFERDKPKNLNFRSVAGGGLGLRPIKNDRTELELLAGGAWNRTWLADGDTNTPEALAGMTFKHKFTDRVRFQNTFTFFQNITAITEFRHVFDANLTFDMTKRIGFQIGLGDRFNNAPIGTAKKNDFLFTTGIKWAFGKKKK